MAHFMKTHGLSGTITHTVWKEIKTRCKNPKSKDWPLYGGRGIMVCKEWDESYVAFLFDMGERPSKLYSIERLDVNGHYQPGNCIWATFVEQANNKRNSLFMEFEGKKQTIAQWSKETGIAPPTLYQRVSLGWHPKDVLTPRTREQARAGQSLEDLRGQHSLASIDSAELGEL